MTFARPSSRGRPWCGLGPCCSGRAPLPDPQTAKPCSAQCFGRMEPMPSITTAAQSAAESIAFLGGGNMARAIIAGLLRQGRPPSSVRVGEPRAALCTQLMNDYGITADTDNAGALAGAALVVLA